MTDHRWTHATYVLKKQIFKLVGSNFFIYDANGALVLFVHQKGFKLKEDIRIYTDENKTTEVLRIAARKAIDFSASYDVYDSASNERIGVLRRKGWKSIARDEWEVCDANEVPFGQLIEDTLLLALVRRILTALVPQYYDLFVQGQKAVDIYQNFNPFAYNLNIKILNPSLIDTRLTVASCILLAAIEGRQSGG